jgi:very-short-patch-repair endonuclease
MTDTYKFLFKEKKILFNNACISAHKDYAYLYSASEVHKYAREFNLYKNILSSRPGNWLSDRNKNSGRWYSILEQERRYISLNYSLKDPIPVLVVGKGRYAETFMSYSILKLYILDCISVRAIDNSEMHFVNRVKQTRSELEFSKYLTEIALSNGYTVEYQVPIAGYRVDFRLYKEGVHDILLEYDEIRHKNEIERDLVRWEKLKTTQESYVFLRVKESEQHKFIAELARCINNNKKYSINKLQAKYKGYS